MEEKKQDKITRKRTLQDKAISGLNSLKYQLTEPVKLGTMRREYAKDYENIENDPLVSVYIPTYNRGAILIERAVASVLKQTYKNVELIVIGDHCTDSTEELLLEIDDPRLKFYNLPERKYRYPETAENHWLAGPVVPANKALELLQGEWIARTDDDDSWTDDHIEVLLRFAQKGNYEFVSAAHQRERYGKKEIIYSDEEIPKIGGTQTWLYRSYLKFFKYNINCWRKSWNRVNDTDIQDRMFKAGVKMGFLDQVVAYILPRPGEKTVGLEAYKVSEKEKMDHFKF